MEYEIEQGVLIKNTPQENADIVKVPDGVKETVILCCPSCGRFNEKPLSV